MRHVAWHVVWSDNVMSFHSLPYLYVKMVNGLGRKWYKLVALVGASFVERVQAARYCLCKYEKVSKAFFDEVMQFDGISLESNAEEICAYLTEMPYDECCLCSEKLEQVEQTQMTNKEYTDYKNAFALTC